VKFLFLVASRAPSLVRKQYSQLIRHRDQTLACNFLISSLLNRRFVSVNLLFYVCTVPIVQEKKGTMCLIQCTSVTGMEFICILSHNVFSESYVHLYCTRSCLQIYYFTLLLSKVFEIQPRYTQDTATFQGGVK